MLFAIADYRRYKRREGRYSPGACCGLMRGAYCGGLSPKAQRVLRPGDMLFFQTLDSLQSWLVMYIGNSEVSHVAIYIGNGEIAHVTTSGTRIDRLSTFFSDNISLMPVLLFLPEDRIPRLVEHLCSQIGRPYGWFGVLKRGVLIALGRYRRNFNLRLVFDIATVLAFTEALVSFLSGTGPIFLAPSLYIASVVVFAASWRLLPQFAARLAGTPQELFEWAAKKGLLYPDCDVLARQIEGDRAALD